jgi:hypothetical protein
MQSQKYLKKIIGFRGRIIFIVVGILSLSYSLGTFLSVLTFEKIYLKELTSKYEILGKDLKRKIETALKFGKRLDGFVGMENIVRPLYGKTDDISEIFLSDIDGNTIFFSGKTELTDSGGSAGKDYSAKIRGGSGDILSPVRMRDLKAKETEIREYDGKYYLLIPILPPLGGERGVLGIAFGKSAINEKKAFFIREFRNKLIFSIVLTSLLVGFLIEFFFIRPVSRTVGRAAQEIFENPISIKIGGSGIPPEVEEIHKQISEEILFIRDSKKGLSMNLCKLENLLAGNESAANEIRFMRGIIDGK